MSSIITVGLVAAALANQALANQIETSRPDVGPLEPRFRVSYETRADGTWNTRFSIAEPLCVGHWVVLTFDKTSNRFGSESSSGVGWSGGGAEKEEPPSLRRAEIGETAGRGLIACNLDTGRAIELIPPRPNRQPDRLTSILFHYCFGADRCAVVIQQLQKTGIDTGKVLGTYLWEWSLETNSLKPIGNWDVAALLKLILDPQFIDASLVAADPEVGQTVELRDKQTGRATRIVLEQPPILKPCDGEAAEVFGDAPMIFPQPDRRSFVFCSWPEDETRFECIDPRSPNGRRWMLTKAKLEAPTGQQHQGIFPIGGLSLENGLFAIVMHDAVEGPDHLAIVDGSTGQTKRIVPLPKEDPEEEFREPLVLSPDVSTAAFVSTLHRGTETIRTVSTVNTKTGRVTKRKWDAGKRFPYLENLFFAVDDRGRMLMRNADFVDRITLDKSLSTERIFQLNPLITQHDNKMSVASIRRLADLKSLTSLKLSRIELSADLLRELRRLPRLEHLEIDLTGEPVGDLSGLAEAANLRSLTLTGNFQNLAAYREVGRLHNLQELDLQLFGVRIPKDALDELGNLTNLVSLRVYGPSADGLKLAPWRALKNLKTFKSGWFPLSDADLATLSELPQLAHLDIYAAATGAGVKHLKSLAHLTDLRLNLDRNPNCDAIVSELAACRHLRRLRLANNALSPGVLQKLGQLPELSGLCRLNLESTSITDDGLHHLAAIESLEDLDLSSTAITDAGLKELRSLKNLRSLALKRTAVTEAGLSELQALPHLASLSLGR